MLEAKTYDDQAIRELFRQYIDDNQLCERHSAESVRCAKNFDDFCSDHISGGYLAKIEAYVMMTDCAVEFEEDGFVAGFRAAMKLSKGQEPVLEPKTTNSTKMTGKTEPEATESSDKPVMEQKAALNNYITSLQIAEMFMDRNFKVVRRIENYIMPMLDEESKKFFTRVEGLNACNKPMVFYRLNRAACEIYLKQMDTKMYCVNVAAGCAKLQQLMNQVFQINRKKTTA